MKKLIFMTITVMLLFTVSVKAIPTDKDVSKNFKTEVIQSVFSVETLKTVINFNFCQRTDVQVTSDVMQLYVFMDELIYPSKEKNKYNNTNNLLSIIINNQRFSNITYDFGKRNNINDIIFSSFI